MLSCRDIARNSSEYLEGDMPFMKRLETRAHMFICGPCRRYMSQVMLTIGTLKTLYQSKTPPEPMVEAVTKEYQRSLAEEEGQSEADKSD